jgi:hypothetical protein
MWRPLTAITNEVIAAAFSDKQPNAAARGFYRAACLLSE